MADVCFTAAYSQTSRVTGIPMHGTRVWPGQACKRVMDKSACWIMSGAFGGLRGTSLAEEQTFQTNHSHQGCNGVNVDDTGTTIVNSNLDAKEWISYAKDKSWHVCVLSVFVLMYAPGSIINQQCVWAENSPLRAVLCTGSKRLISFTISSG